MNKFSAPKQGHNSTRPKHPHCSQATRKVPGSSADAPTSQQAATSLLTSSSAAASYLCPHRSLSSPSCSITSGSEERDQAGPMAGLRKAASWAAVRTVWLLSKVIQAPSERGIHRLCSRRLIPWRGTDHLGMGHPSTAYTALPGQAQRVSPQLCLVPSQRWLDLARCTASQHGDHKAVK